MILIGGRWPALDIVTLLRLESRTAYADGGHRVGLEPLDLAVEPGEDVGGVVGLHGVGAQGASDPAHDDGGAQAAAGDVADGDADVAGREREQVVPVAADTDLGARHVARRYLESRDRRGAGWQQAALQGQRGRAVELGQPSLSGEAGAVGDELQEFDVVVGEVPMVQGADMEDADETTRVDHRYAEDGRNSLGEQQRVDDVAAVDVFDGNRAPLRRDCAGESFPDAYPESLLYLFLETLGGGSDEFRAGRVEQEHDGGLGPEQIAGALQQFGEKLFDAQLRESRIGDTL